MTHNELNQVFIEILSTSLLLLLAVEMLARVFINTWFEIKSLITKTRKDEDDKY